jgi:hypothetical protein
MTVNHVLYITSRKNLHVHIQGVQCPSNSLHEIQTIFKHVEIQYITLKVEGHTIAQLFEALR